MNKIVLNTGLLFFFLAVIYYGQRGFPIVDVLLKSFIIFVFSTIVLAVIALFIVKSFNKNSYRKAKDMIENILGNGND